MRRITIQADVIASLQGMDKVVTQLQQGLREGTTSTDLTKGLGNNLSKLTDKFKKEYSQFSNLTKNGVIDFSRSEEGVRVGKKLIGTFEELQRVMGDLSTKSTIDLKKMFPEAFDSRIDDLRNSMSSLLQDLDTLASKRITQAGLETNINSLTTKIEALRNQLIEESVIKVKTKEADAAKATVDELNKKVEELRKNLGQELELKTATNTSELEKLNKEAQALQERLKASEKDFSADGKKYKGKTQKEWESSSESERTKAKAARAFEDRAKDLKRQREIKNEQTELERERKALIGANDSFIKKGDLSKTAKEMGKGADEVSKITQLYKDQAEATEKSKQATAELNQMQTANKNTTAALDKENAALQQKSEKYALLNRQISELESKTNATDIGRRFKELAPNFDFSPELLKSGQGLQALYVELSRIEAVQADKLIQDLSQFGLNAEEARAAVDRLRSGIETMTLQAHEIKRAEQDMKNLTNRMLYFFSTTNQVQLFKRAVRSAMNTIKELDQTMAEAAVVTKYSIEDMWGKMPEYSKTAQQLGISINGMYQATTLYYQQGLKSNEAMQLGIETMKMARIAGLESADATEAMTSALRGFNMELNKASAERINNVYSQLAATSASNVQQISTAMEKTASIASAANMEFETTAALLAQIIETTQEAPETAGTALKTIIARFSEVKSLRDKGAISGEDAEGEALDVNGIQTALRSVGISMEGFFAGTEGLDSVLLKLAEKWNTLDFETQRYIATMAAGSRQQSRFIAMMSDYGRTQELVTEATESSGASYKQFNKTMESLEAKVQKLKNAWNEFLMNLANSEIVKRAVDFLTTILTAVNKLSGGIENGLVKSILSLVMAFAALKAGLKVASLASYAVEKKMKLRPTVGEESSRGFQNGQAYGKSWAEGYNSTIQSSTSAPAQAPASAPAQAPTDQGEQDQQGQQAKKTKKMTKKQRRKLRTKQEREEKAQKKEAQKQKNGQGPQRSQQDEKQQPSGETPDKNLEKGNKQLAVTQQQAEQTQQALGKVSGGFFAAGGACMAFAAVLSAMGLEEASEAASTLGVVFVGLGGAISLLNTIVGFVPGLLKLMGKAGLEAGAETATGFVLAEAAAGPVLLIAIAIMGAFIALAVALVLVISLVKNAVEKMKAASLEGQIEQLSENMSAMGDVAEEAKNKIEDLAKSREELESMGKTFEGLVKGSAEWRDALIENNEKVLTLLDNYPKLIDYIKHTSDGRLYIEEEGFSKAIAAQQSARTNALNAKTLMTQQRQQKEFELEAKEKLTDAWTKTDVAKIFGGITAGILAAPFAGLAAGVPVAAAKGANSEDFQKGALEFSEGVFDFEVGLLETGKEWNESFWDFFGVKEEMAWTYTAGPLPDLAENAKVMREQTRTGGLSYEEFGDLSAEIAARGIAGDDEKIRELYTQMGFDPSHFEAVYEQIENLGENFEGLSQQALELKLAEQTRLGNIAEQNAASSAYISASKYSDAATNMATTIYADYDERIEEAKKEFSYDRKEDAYHEDNKEIISMYAELQHMEEDEVRAKLKSEELSYETMATVLATAKVDKEQTKAMEGLVRVLNQLENTLDKERIAGIEGIMTDNGLGLTRSQIEAIDGMGVENYFADITDDQLVAMEYVKDDGTADRERFEQDMLFRLGNAKAALKNAEDTVGKYVAEGLGKELLLQIGSMARSGGVELSIEQEQKFANVIKDVEMRGGDATGLVQNFAGLTKGLVGEQLDQAMTILSTADWKTSGGIDAAVAALRNLGAEIDETLIKDLYALSQAIKKVNIDSIRTRLESLAKIMDELEKKVESGERTFTTEQRDQLVAAGMDKENFIAIGFDEWVSLDTTNSLLEAIEKNTFNLLDESKKDIETQIAQGEKIDEAMKLNYDIVDNGQTQQLNGEQLIRQLKVGAIDTESGKDGKLVERTVLESLAANMGITETEMRDLTNDGLIGLIVSRYDDLYGESGVVLKQNYNTRDELAKQEDDMRLAMVAGTEDIYRDASGEEAAQRVMDGLIKAEAGLGVAVEQVTNSLINQESMFTHSAISAKNLVIASAKANKNLAILGTVLENNGEVLINAAENSWEYCGALETVAEAAKKVFGDKVDPSFVSTHKLLFADLAKGGEIAQKAFEQLSEYYTKEFLKDGNINFEQVKAALSGIFEGVDPGAAIDLTGYYESLMKIEGMTEATAKNILQSWGFSVMTSKEWLTNSAGEIVNGSIAGVRIDANQFAGSKAGEKWENPYDKFYNTYEKINSLMREREKIERRYDRLLRDRNVSGEDLVNNSKKELENLKSQAKLQKYLRQGKSNEIDETLAKNKSLVSAYSVTIDKETGVINFDEKAVDAIQGTATGEAFEKLISKLEGLCDQYQETEDAVEEIEDAIYENKTRYQDDYFDMEDRIKEAVLADRQSQIEALQNINDSINEANSKMLEAMQAQIQAYRQSRDNEKAEKEIADKQTRLAYLSQDTSGANATEILKLQKEISDAQESYIDNLIDQKITELQEQNDKAAEQRERQIGIMEAQLEQYEKTGEVWDDVEEIWRTGITSDGKLMTDSRLSKLLAESEGLQGMSKLGSEQWSKDLAASIAKAYAHLENQNSDVDDEGEDDTLPPEKGGINKGEVPTTPTDPVVNGSGLNAAQTAWLQDKLHQLGFSTGADKAGENGKATKFAARLYLGSRGILVDKEEDAIYSAFQELTKGEAIGKKYSTITGKSANGVVSDVYKKFSEGQTDQTITYNNVPYRAVKDRNGILWLSGNPENGVLGTIYHNKKFERIDAFKTGGLADYTGPAWLDGTKTKPELVLNARDTQNFIQLKDILASLMGNTSSKSSEKAGETTYDIDINVETIKDETDLDMIANYIENKIVASANYRNNTIIGGRR